MLELIMVATSRSFVFMLIRPTALISKQISFWNLLVVASLERLTSIFYLVAIMKEVFTERLRVYKERLKSSFCN